MALMNDGWTITKDPFMIRLGTMRLEADMAAERMIAAERNTEKIAVEVKSFIGASKMTDLEKAIGQFGLYAALLSEIEPERIVYLAISERVFIELFDTSEGRIVIRQLSLRLIVVALDRNEVVLWIN